MKKIGKIMDEMGFQKNSSPETQKAFIKHLVRIASKNCRPLLEIDTDEPDEWKTLSIINNQSTVDKAMENSKDAFAEQLSFDFESEAKVVRKSG